MSIVNYNLRRFADRRSLIVSNNTKSVKKYITPQKIEETNSSSYTIKNFGLKTFKIMLTESNC